MAARMSSQKAKVAEAAAPMSLYMTALIISRCGIKVSNSVAAQETSGWAGKSKQKARQAKIIIHIPKNTLHIRKTYCCCVSVNDIVSR